MASPKKELRPIPGQKYQLFKRHPNINNGRHTHLDYATNDADMRAKKEKYILELPGWQIIEVMQPRRYWPPRKLFIVGHSWQVVGTNEHGHTIRAMVDANDLYLAMCKAIQEKGILLQGLKMIKYEAPIYAEEE